MRQLKITKQVTNRETASLDKYLQEIGRVDLITAEEEVELAQKIKAGDEKALVFLDANECAHEPFVGAPNLARYSMQQPRELQQAFCHWLDVSSRNPTITRGADEAIDCLIRGFCEPGVDNIVICPPTFAMYAQSAMLQGVEIRQAPLTEGFELDPAAIASAMDDATKLVFVCSPNNPTGNVMNSTAIAELCIACDGRSLVVVDETYIEYAIDAGCHGVC